MEKAFVRFLALVAALAMASLAHADSGAEGFVKSRHEKLTALIKVSSSAKPADKPAIEAKIDSIFEEMLDYDELAKQSLRKHWDERSAEERARFECILRQLVKNSYRKDLDKTSSWAVSYRGEDRAKDGFLVRTIAKSKTDKRKESISIDYVVVKVDGRWIVRDIVTEGSSLVSNYEGQFRRIIRKDGFAGLLRRMSKKLEESGTPASC